VGDDDVPLRVDQRSAELSIVEVAGGAAVSMTWSSLRSSAERMAGFLTDAGIGPGGVVVIEGSTSLRTLVVAFAAWQAGAAVSISPSHETLGPVAAIRALSERCKHVKPAAVYLPKALWQAADDSDGDAQGVRRLDEEIVDRILAASCSEAATEEHGRLIPPRDVDLDAVALIQSTSGTTSEARLVSISWRMLLANLIAIQERLALDPDDRFVSWMPLYHDMGLVGYLLLPALLGCRTTLLPTFSFVRSPWLLLEEIQRIGGTITGSPTFGIALLIRALRSRGPYDLSTLRHLVWGAELIDINMCNRLAILGREHSLRPDVFAFAYGMAEATLGVSIRPRSRPSDAHFHLSHGWMSSVVAPPRSRRGYAFTGPPLNGLEVRVVDRDSQHVLNAEDVGELQIRGDSVVRAYFGPAATSSTVTTEGWLSTGDLGCIVDGEVVVIGRSKDIVVVAGHNVFPEDVERIVGRIDGIRPGRVAAVQCNGPAGEALAILAELSGAARVQQREIRRAVHEQLGVSPAVVAFVDPGTLPKTSSGKLRRAACRELLHQEVDVS